MEQAEISRLMVKQALEGKVVVRLKGGDPLVYGHGGEEALACAEAGIEFEIIPGVSAAQGAASCAGVPLTHRGVASSVAFVTAHAARCKDSPDLTWKHLAAAVDTLVIFMGGSWLDKIAGALIEAGLAPTTPVAVVSNATREDQQTVLGTLTTIAERVTRAHLETPMLTIVGKVARFSSTLNWFERRQWSVSSNAPIDLTQATALEQPASCQP